MVVKLTWGSYSNCTIHACHVAIRFGHARWESHSFYDQMDPVTVSEWVIRFYGLSRTAVTGNLKIYGHIYWNINDITGTIFILHLEHLNSEKTSPHPNTHTHTPMIITRDSEVIMFSPCVFVCLFVCVCLCLSRCLSGRFNYEGLVPHQQYFAITLLGISSCASYVSHTHDVIDDVTRSQSRSNFEIYISPSIFELERRSKAQNVGNANDYLSGIFNFRYNFR